MKLNRVLLWFIILLVGLTTLISFPSLPVKFSIGDKTYDRIIKGPDLFGKKMDIKLGLDLQGGSFISLRADMTGVPENEKGQRIEAARKVMENRVNQFGISEAYVYSSISGNDYKINIELPGAGADTENQISVLKQTAKLEFFRQKEPQPEIPENFDSLPVEVQLNYLYDKLNISGADLKSASVTAPTSGGSTPITGDSKEVAMVFSEEGFKKFDDMARASRGKRIAIALDNNIISAPTISESWGLTGGVSSTVTINGLTSQEAENLAIQLRGGALPVPVELAEQKVIEATLGKDALLKSIQAGLVGIFLIMTFMIFLYRKEGIIASIALVIYTLISLSLYKLLPIPLTLPGIAGFILSIGIAVDANILIFERMNEEIKKGYSKQKALKLGFDRAWTSIRDSNISTLITCFILYMVGATVVKGFAFNLALGVLISLFTAVSVTRQLLIVISKK